MDDLFTASAFTTAHLPPPGVQRQLWFLYPPLPPCRKVLPNCSPLAPAGRAALQSWLLGHFLPLAFSVTSTAGSQTAGRVPCKGRALPRLVASPGCGWFIPVFRRGTAGGLQAGVFSSCSFGVERWCLLMEQQIT